MAVTPKKPSLLWSRLHFVLRFLGLTGATCAAVGLALLQPAAFNDVYAPVTDPAAALHAQIGGHLFVWGAGVAVLALLFELIGAVGRAAGQRSAFGFNAIVQVALAVVLLVVVNLVSTGYKLPSLRPYLGKWWQLDGYNARVDLTRDKTFTLPDDLKKELEKLDPDSRTTVIVYLRHKPFSGINDKPDRYDFAAERKVVEKVKDLVELLREAGPRFEVEVLNVDAEGYDARVNRLTKDDPALRKAIDAAPENTIFIVAKDPANAGKTFAQQMSFNELYQLDRVASKEANGGRGNLVLLGQGDGRGARPFVQRILAVQQRRPRVGLLVVHDVLTTESNQPEFSAAGLKKSLQANGYDVHDVVIKKGWGGRGPLQATADTYEESRLDRIDRSLERLPREIALLEKAIKSQEKDHEEALELKGDELRVKITQMLLRYLGPSALSEYPTLRAAVEALNGTLVRNKALLKSKSSEQERLQQEKARMDLDRIWEGRQLIDARAKLEHATRDCDLLLVPRLTRISATGQMVPARLHHVTPEQAEVVREFLKAGKPVLACLGPVNDPDQSSPAPPADGPDKFEELLGELGFWLSNHTVLFSSDAESLTQRADEGFRNDQKVETPPIDFDVPTRSGYGPLRAGDDRLANPLRRSLRVTSRNLGAGFDLRLRFPRPVYYLTTEERRFSTLLAGAVVGSCWDCWPASLALAGYATTLPGPEQKERVDATFLVTATGWTDPQMITSPERRPQYEQESSVRDQGSLDAQRQAAFPIGAAVEVPLPPEWGAPAGRTARVAVIGQGDLFTGLELNPARERLLLQTTSWLLNRDDYLPRADHPPLTYKRVRAQPGTWEYRAWVLAMALGLPGLCAYLGFVVLLYRRLR